MSSVRKKVKRNVFHLPVYTPVRLLGERRSGMSVTRTLSHASGDVLSEISRIELVRGPSMIPSSIRPAGVGVSASGWAHPATRSISISPLTSNLLPITISLYRDQAMLSGAQQVFYKEIQNYLFNFIN